MTTGIRSMFRSGTQKRLLQILSRWGIVIYLPIYTIPSLGGSDTETKLQCRLEITKETLNVQLDTTRESRAEAVTVDILESGKILTIGIMGARPIASVYTSIGGTSKSYQNRSTDTVWELSNESAKGPANMRVTIRIDRNTGFLSFTSDVVVANVGLSEETGSGYCSKIDPTKRKF